MPDPNSVQLYHMNLPIPPNPATKAPPAKAICMCADPNGAVTGAIEYADGSKAIVFITIHYIPELRKHLNAEAADNPLATIGITDRTSVFLALLAQAERELKTARPQPVDGKLYEQFTQQSLRLLKDTGPKT